MLQGGGAPILMPQDPRKARLSAHPTPQLQEAVRATRNSLLEGLEEPFTLRATEADGEIERTSFPLDALRRSATLSRLFLTLSTRDLDLISRLTPTLLKKSKEAL